MRIYIQAGVSEVKGWIPRQIAAERRGGGCLFDYDKTLNGAQYGDNICNVNDQKLSRRNR